MVLATVAVIGSAGIAWAVGGDPQVRPRPSATTTSSSAVPTSVGAAPTPVETTTVPAVVEVVPGSTPSESPVGTAVETAVDTTVDTTVGSTEATTTTSEPDRTQAPHPTRTRPGKGVRPTPRPTKSQK